MANNPVVAPGAAMDLRELTYEAFCRFAIMGFGTLPVDASVCISVPSVARMLVERPGGQKTTS